MFPLIDVYFDEGVINLIIQDIISQKTFCLNQYIECPRNPCKWILIDLNYFIDKINDKTIQSYCGKCADTKKTSVADSNLRKLNNDLLEFDF
jgi:hypothetical protein